MLCRSALIQHVLAVLPGDIVYEVDGDFDTAGQLSSQLAIEEAGIVGHQGDENDSVQLVGQFYCWLFNLNVNRKLKSPVTLVPSVSWRT